MAVDPDALVRPHLERLAALRSEPERSEYRRRVTERDPLLFALLYLRKHITANDGSRSLSSVHVAWARSAMRWAETKLEPMADRHAEVAPREMGKTTWWFLLLPMWAAAHGHVKFCAAFADTDTQAQTHLATFKSELDNNALIRADYPELVNPKTRGRGQVEADRVSLYHAKSGFVFAAAGMDSANLGLKVGSQRPDLIVLDDIEPHEGRYSKALATKRLDTLRSAILPLNIYAHVIIVGTVTMQDSIVHQIVEYARGERHEGNEWVADEHIVGRHFPAITLDDDGERVSIWPEKWPLSFLESIEHTRPYAKNYANDPLGADGDYWNLDDFVHAELEGVTQVIVSLDPAVTTRGGSDYSGIAVLGRAPASRKVTVLECRQVKKDGASLRLDVIDAALRHGARVVVVEVNQGGDLWRTILWGIPAKLRVVNQSASKEVRAADALNHYQRGRVVHDPKADLRALEGQMVAFPNAPHDDMVDAVTTGVRYFLSPDTKPKVAVGGESISYA